MNRLPAGFRREKPCDHCGERGEGQIMTPKPASVWRATVVWWCVIVGMSGCIPVEPVPSSSMYWEAEEVPDSQVLTDYNACKLWSIVKYAESKKREEIITDNLGYWIHVPLLKACMEHKGYTYVGPEGGPSRQPQ
jgi:hypothetical protein